MIAAERGCYPVISMHGKPGVSPTRTGSRSGTCCESFTSLKPHNISFPGFPNLPYLPAGVSSRGRPPSMHIRPFKTMYLKALRSILKVILLSASPSFFSLIGLRENLIFIHIKDILVTTTWATYLTRPGISTGRFLYLSSSLLSRHSTMASITRPSRLPRPWMPLPSNSEHTTKPVALTSLTQSGYPCSIA